MHNPIQVTANNVDAVVKPFTLNPSLNIVPAPKKPIPDNNCAGILDESTPKDFDIYSPHTITNTALIPTKACVLKPAGLLQDDLSNPIIPAKITPNNNLIIV